MLLTRLRQRSSGFTLVELMIVVAIIGILAAVAIPAFSRYIKKSRTAEAMGHLNKMWSGSVTYYEQDHIIPATNLPANKQFPGDGLAAADPSGGTRCCMQQGAKCDPAIAGAAFEDITTGVWLALNFSVPDPFNYVPAYISANTGTAAVFTAEAFGDLDCDNILSTFRRLGGIDPVTGDVSGSRAPIVLNELE